MKKILLFASAALLLAGCAKEIITPTENPDNNSQKGDLTLSFSASQTGIGTKAVIGETTTDTEGVTSTAINWQSTDKISVFDGAGANCEFSTKDFNAETTSCTFEGTVTELATDYVAVYPYTAAATISETEVISGISLPAIQTAVAGSFDPKAALMAAKTVDGGRELAFENLVGYVKVITDFDCKKIELCAASEEALAGAGTISFDKGTPSFTLSDGAVTSITLSPAGDGTTIAAGTYYIAVPATTLAAGWSIRLTDTDDIVSTKKDSKDITFKQSTVLNLGTISKIEPRYLTFSAESEQTFTMNFKPDKDASAFTLGDGEYFEYRVGKDEWTLPTENTISDVTFGGSHGDLQLRGISSKGTAEREDEKWTTISFGNEATEVSCSGDIRTLVNYKDYENANTSNARFCNLFVHCSQLTSAPDLPATKLASCCYYNMFADCTSLKTAPELPATTLAESCYNVMFLYCSSLTTAPELPATTLADYCYEGMFGYCSSLVAAPKLPATTLADECYWDMFNGCSSLTTAPELPATTLAELCYCGMFGGCSSLTTAPDLPATTLAPCCYESMFAGCTSLQTVELPATTLADVCYRFMFQGCSALQTVYIKAKPSLDETDPSCFEGWLDGAGNSLSEIYCYESFYNFVKGASEFGLTLCPGYWSFYDIDNTWSQWGQY